MPTPEQERYARALQAVAQRFTRLEDTTIRRAVALLQEVRKSIAAEMASTDWQTYRLRELQAGIQRTIDQFEAQLSADMRGQFAGLYEAGQAGVVEPLQAIGVPAFFQPNTAQVNAVMDFSADLVQQIGADMRGKINNQIRLSVLGERSPFQAMQGVTQVLGVKASDGVWGRRRRPEVVSGVAARAEAIIRTESTRVFNLAHHSQQLATAEQIPELRKRWIATGDDRTRISHLNAHIRYENDPIPPNEAFEVGTARLLYPGDPAGPPGETINCRCRVVSVYPELMEPVELPVDRKVKQAKAKRDEEERRKRPPRRQLSEFEQENKR